MSPALSPERIAGDARLLLHKVDPTRRQLILRRTTADAVRSAAFIDGRTDIWTGEPLAISFDDALALKLPEPEERRYIFHMSFCGSTLLARLLDRPGKTLSLKEPNCLVDLAYWRTALVAANAATTEFDPVLQFAAATLGRSWNAGEQVVVKPSSWANNLIDKLSPAAGRAVFVTIARDRFVEAVVRGGNDRLAFTARLAAHLSPFVSGGPAALQSAIDSTEDPLGKVARLALVAHDLELRLFEAHLGGDQRGAVDLAEIEDDPAGAASTAATILGLRLGADEIDENCGRWTREHAKADAAYSSAERRVENDQVRAQYGELIDSALNWSETALGPPLLQR